MSVIMDLNDVFLILAILGLALTIFSGWHIAKYIPLTKENEQLKENLKKMGEEIRKEKRKNIQANVHSDLPENYRKITKCQL